MTPRRAHRETSLSSFPRQRDPAPHRVGARRGLGSRFRGGDAGRRDAAPCRASLGYWLGEAHHGRGYMAEAAPAAVRAGFRWLGVGVIEAAAQRDNPASVAVLRRLGMRHIGERPVHASARGRDEPCLAYELTRPGA